jgi:hypothetical protein
VEEVRARTIEEEAQAIISRSARDALNPEKTSAFA